MGETERIAGVRRSAAAATPAVSVVVPTHGRRASLLRMLRSLSSQTAPPGTFEVVVICDGDVDGSAAACRDLTLHVPYELRVIEQQNQGPAATRNAGVMQARGHLIVFLDDDVVPDKHLIETHRQAHVGHPARATFGPLLLPPDARLQAWSVWDAEALARQYADMVAGRWMPTWRQFYTGNASILKQQIIAVGGFDATLSRAEDVELACRLQQRGVEFVFLPEARGWHYVRRPFASWLRVPGAYGAADVTIARSYLPGLMDVVAGEFRARHWAVRALAWSCAGRLLAVNAAVRLLSGFVRVADRIHVVAPARPACSLIFNLCYYDSLARALGGRAVFTRLLHGDASWRNDAATAK